MTTQVFVASTAFGLATVVAALDDGAFDAAERRILLLSHNAATPETGSRIEEVAGVQSLLSRFDVVHDYNSAIAPQHPSLWSPRTQDLPLLERWLTQRWSLGDDVHLMVESIQVSPALSLCRIFPDARIDVYADGLMSYGPTRTKLPPLVASRIERLLHLDLVPGLVPVLLSEHHVPAELISAEAFRRTVATLGEPSVSLIVRDHGGVAVLLGQYLSAAGILTPEEETCLHVEMLHGAAASGFGEVVFKPHPAAPPILAQPLVDEAARLGVSLTVHDAPELVETWFRSGAVGGVIGCFSTALLTASTLYQLPTARVGTELLLERLTPYQNSNRIPVTLVDAVVPRPSGLGSSGQDLVGPENQPGPKVDLVQLLHAVSYCMQPQRYPGLRPAAHELLSEHGEEVRRYFKRRRLTRLKLPGGLVETRARPNFPRGLRRAAGRLVMGRRPA